MRYVLKLWSVRGKGNHGSKKIFLTFLKSAYQKLCKTAWSTQDFLIWEKWATLMLCLNIWNHYQSLHWRLSKLKALFFHLIFKLCNYIKLFFRHLMVSDDTWWEQSDSQLCFLWNDTFFYFLAGKATMHTLGDIYRFCLKKNKMMHKILKTPHGQLRPIHPN